MNRPSLPALLGALALLAFMMPADFAGAHGTQCSETQVITVAALTDAGADISPTVGYTTGKCYSSDETITVYRSSPTPASDDGISYCSSGCNETWPMAFTDRSVVLDVSSADAASPPTITCIIAQCQ